MKTYKELFKKWKGLQCVCNQDCNCESVNEFGLGQAIAEHDKEIKGLIDEMQKDLQTEQQTLQNSDIETADYDWEVCDIKFNVLTELLEKLK